MINDDIIVKYSLKRLNQGFSPDSRIQDWVDYTRFLKEQILYIKLGFTGLGDGDMSLISFDQVHPGDRIILDDNLDCNCGSYQTDHAALMGIINPDMTFTIEAIGQGYDFTRDPDRIVFNPGKTIQILENQFYTVLRIDAKPRPDGGSLYYFFNKSVHDARY